MKIQAISPARISLFGGGSDVDPYASRYGGMTISMAISIRQKITMYNDNDIFELLDNVFPHHADPKLFYSIFKKYGIDGGHLTRVTSEFDGRVGAGLGSSASACVALIGSINKRKSLGMSLKQIAHAAWQAEQAMGWHGGRQDQWTSAFGGLNLFHFSNGKISRTEFSQEFADELTKYLLLFDTGGVRASHEIQKGFLKLSQQQTKKLHLIRLLAKRAFTLIMDQDFEPLGQVLHESWQVKKESNKGITNTKIDDIYDMARNAGATGGKLLGAGGCGYMIFWVPPIHQDKVIHRMEQEGYDHVIYYPDEQGLEVKEL